MRNSFWIFLVFAVLSCTSSKNLTKSKNYSEYEIVSTPLIVEKDTIFINELRFYKIQSALDGMKLMYRNYGNWNKKISGIHQRNINRIVWKNIKLIEEKDETFTVIADGTETQNEYYACLMVFDSKEEDCLRDEHPYKKELIKLFTDKMNKVDKKLAVYKLFR